MRIVIVGSGVMGSGIAISSILAGYETLVFDISSEATGRSRQMIETDLARSVEKGRINAEKQNAALNRLTFTENKDELIGDLILEAIIERLEVKKQLFAELEKINRPETIMATNTSSIPITQIGAGLENPERLVGIHFFNPAQVMKLVEIISGVQTRQEIAEKAYKWAESLGKTAVYAKDAPGFIVNRVARHYYVEGLKLLEENVAELEQIDRLCESAGFKLGPYRLMDLIGVETNFSVTSSMYNQFHQDSKFRPSRIQQQKVDAGHFGRKTGKGFYDYES